MGPGSGAVPLQERGGCGMRSAALQRQHFANSRLAALPASPAPNPPEVCYFLAFSPFPPCLNKFENIASLRGAQPAGSAHQPPLLAAAPAGAARSRRGGRADVTLPAPPGQPRATRGGDPGPGPGPVQAGKGSPVRGASPTPAVGRRKAAWARWDCRKSPAGLEPSRLPLRVALPGL